MVYKYCLPFHRLFFNSIDHFLCCGTFWLYVVPHSELTFVYGIYQVKPPHLFSSRQLHCAEPIRAPRLARQKPFLQGALPKLLGFWECKPIHPLSYVKLGAGDIFFLIKSCPRVGDTVPGLGTLADSVQNLPIGPGKSDFMFFQGTGAFQLV